MLNDDDHDDHDDHASNINNEAPLQLPSRATSPPLAATTTAAAAVGTTLPKPRRKKTVSYSQLSHLFYLPLREAMAKLGVKSSKFKELCRDHKIDVWPYRPVRQIAKNIEYYKSMVLSDSVTSDDKQFGLWIISRTLRFFEEILMNSDALNGLEAIQIQIAGFQSMPVIEKRLLMASEIAENPYYLSLNQYSMAEDLYKNTIAVMQSEENRYKNINMGRVRKQPKPIPKKAAGSTVGSVDDDAIVDGRDDYDDSDNEQDDFEEFEIASNQIDVDSNRANNAPVNISSYNSGNSNRSGGGRNTSGRASNNGVDNATNGSDIDLTRALRDIPLSISKVDLKFVVVHEQIENGSACIPKLRYEVTDNQNIVLPRLKTGFHNRGSILNASLSSSSSSAAAAVVEVEVGTTTTTTTVMEKNATVAEAEVDVESQIEAGIQSNVAESNVDLPHSEASLKEAAKTVKSMIEPADFAQDQELDIIPMAMTFGPDLQIVSDLIYVRMFRDKKKERAFYYK